MKKRGPKRRENQKCSEYISGGCKADTRDKNTRDKKPQRNEGHAIASIAKIAHKGLSDRTAKDNHRGQISKLRHREIEMTLKKSPQWRREDHVKIQRHVCSGNIKDRTKGWRGFCGHRIAFTTRRAGE